MSAGHPSASTMAATFTAVRPRLEALAARITSDRDEAADIASEAYIALVERGPKATAEMVPWLFTVTRNRALNRVRDRQRATRRGFPMVDDPPPPTTANGPLRVLLRRASSRLGRRDRTALALRFESGASYGEIAVALGTNENNARVVVHRATARFRREAVGLLAEHHHVDAGCRSALMHTSMSRRVPEHRGCRSCVAVVDEVQALASSALVPVAAGRAVRRAVDRLVARVAVRLPAGDHVNRISEGAAALVVAGSVALLAPASPPLAVVAAAPDAMSGAVALAPASSLEPAGDARVAAPVAVAMAGPPRAIGPAAVAAIAGAPASGHHDAPGDASPLTAAVAQPVASAAPAWAPRVVRDALASEQGQGADIHRFEVATVAGPDGEPSGLRFTIDVDGPPSDDMGYNLTWAYAGTDCTTDRLRVDYAAESKPRTAVWSHSCRTSAGEADGPSGKTSDGRPRDADRSGGHHESWEIDLPFRIEGSRVTIDLPFAVVPAGTVLAPAPGVELAQLFVQAIDYQRPMSLLDGDRAPDDGGISYRAETRRG